MSNDLNSTLAHAVLSCVASNGLRNWSNHGTKSYAAVGMHANLFVHGILGIINSQSQTFNLNVKDIFEVSSKATHFLPISFLNADLYYESDNHLSALHVASGVIPFLLSLQLKDDDKIAKLCLVLNIISLAYYSFDRKIEWGYFTTLAAVFTYFGAKQIGPCMYPLCLAAMEYCSYQVVGY